MVRHLNAALGLTWFRGKLFVTHVVPYSASDGVTYTGRVTAYSRFNGRRFKRHRTIVKGIPTGQHRGEQRRARPRRTAVHGVGSAATPPPARATAGRWSASSRAAGTCGSRRAACATPTAWHSRPTARRCCIRQRPRRPGQQPPAGGAETVRRDRTGAGLRVPALLGLSTADGARARGPRSPSSRRTQRSAAWPPSAFRSLGPNAFVAENGSTIASPPTGSVVRRVPLKSGRSNDVRFATGFGRHEPLGLAIGPGGALYVTLHGSGRLVRFVP